MTRFRVDRAPDARGERDEHYIVEEGERGWYLHTDGILRQFAVVGGTTAYYPSKDAADAALEHYLASLH